MSQSEVARFATTLKADAALRAEVGKDDSLVNAVAVAGRHGYSFTVEDAKLFVAAKAQASGRILTEGELDKLAGGFAPGTVKACSVQDMLKVLALT